MSVDLSIEGIQDAQDENIRAIAALQPTGAGGRAVQFMTAGLHRYAVSVTHVRTGALHASHLMEINGLRGEVYLNPAAVNPKTKKRPAEYGVYEHRRGGEHAFYDRTIDEAGPDLIERGATLAFQGVY